MSVSGLRKRRQVLTNAVEIRKRLSVIRDMAVSSIRLVRDPPDWWLRIKADLILMKQNREPFYDIIIVIL